MEVKMGSGQTDIGTDAQKGRERPQAVLGTDNRVG